MPRLRQHRRERQLVDAPLNPEDILHFELGARGMLPIARMKARLAARDFKLVVVQDRHESTLISTQRPCCLVAQTLPDWVSVYEANARFGVTLCAESLEELPSPHPAEFLDPVRRFRLPSCGDCVVEIDGSIPNMMPTIRIISTGGI